MVPDEIKLDYTIHVFGETAPRKTAENIAYHTSGGVSLLVTKHCRVGEISMTVTTLIIMLQCHFHYNKAEPHVTLNHVITSFCSTEYVLAFQH